MAHRLRDCNCYIKFNQAVPSSCLHFACLSLWRARCYCWHISLHLPLSLLLLLQSYRHGCSWSLFFIIKLPTFCKRSRSHLGATLCLHFSSRPDQGTGVSPTHDGCTSSRHTDGLGLSLALPAGYCIPFLPCPQLPAQLLPAPHCLPTQFARTSLQISFPLRFQGYHWRRVH